MFTALYSCGYSVCLCAIKGLLDYLSHKKKEEREVVQKLPVLCRLTVHTLRVCRKRRMIFRTMTFIAHYWIHRHKHLLHMSLLLPLCYVAVLRWH